MCHFSTDIHILHSNFHYSYSSLQLPLFIFFTPTSIIHVIAFLLKDSVDFSHFFRNKSIKLQCILAYIIYFVLSWHSSTVIFTKLLLNYAELPVKCKHLLMTLMNTKIVENQMVSVRKRNIQGRYNSVRHLQRRYLELPPLHVVSIVDSIVTSSVPISLENTRTRLYI